VHIWGADHSWWDNSPLFEDRAVVGFLGQSRGPLTAYALIVEHHHDFMILLDGARDYALVVAQTEQYQYPMAGANETVHLAVTGGASNIDVYGALSCNWWKPAILEIMTAEGVGANVSFFGLKGVGSNFGLMHQPSTPGLETNGTRADSPFYGIPADVWVPQR